MPNYQQGKVYKIVCNKTGKCYIGSTCEPTLARRLANHVLKYKQYLKTGKIDTRSYEIIESGDYDIVLVESVPCNSKDELYVRERHWILNTDCVNRVKQQGLINEIGNVAYRKLYNQENKERVRQVGKLYYQKYKDKKAAYQKIYLEVNKDKIKAQVKQYHERNKDKLNEKHDCECGGRYTTQSKARHAKSIIHQSFVSNEEQK